MQTHFLTQTMDDLAGFCLERNISASYCDIIVPHFYKNRQLDFTHENRISPKHWQTFQEHFSFTLPKVLRIQSSQDKTHKFLLEIGPGETIETVLVPFPGRYTVCLSSQVGCAMKCSFCYTGTQGLKRHLRTDEIIGQYLVAWDYLREKNPKELNPKIVFMGQGEPLHNFESLKKAITIIRQKEGIYLGPRQITVSTAGYLPGLVRFHELDNVNLAVSLHSPFDEERNELIPLNRSYPLQELIEVLKTISLLPSQFINFEYLLIDGLNDTICHVLALKEKLSSLKSTLNIIPFNPFPGIHYKRPSMDKVNWFKKELQSRGVYTTVRITKGDDILAACGQLTSLK